MELPRPIVLEPFRKILPDGAVRLAGIAAWLDRSGTWEFANDHQADIDRNWQRESAGNPSLFDGTVLVAASHAFDGEQLTARLVAVRYRSFLHWKRIGLPARHGANLFGAAIVRSIDGGVLFGKMAATTAMAGSVYPPCGTPALDDIDELGRLDIRQSIARELAEETGIRTQDGTSAGCFALPSGGMLPVLEVIDMKETADVLRDRARAHIAGETEAELEDVVFVHSVAEAERLGVSPFGCRALAVLARC